MMCQVLVPDNFLLWLAIGTVVRYQYQAYGYGYLVIMCTGNIYHLYCDATYCACTVYQYCLWFQGISTGY